MTQHYSLLKQQVKRRTVLCRAAIFLALTGLPDFHYTWCHVWTTLSVRVCGQCRLHECACGRHADWQKSSVRYPPHYEQVNQSNFVDWPLAPWTSKR